LNAGEEFIVSEGANVRGIVCEDRMAWIVESIDLKLIQKLK
jgi:hypothetical protein